jgi:hypothetical protein
MYLFTFIAIFAVINSTTSISVECEFRDDEWGGGKYGYECFVKSINKTSDSDRTITEIFGKHIGTRTNCDVVQFDCRIGNLGRFPTNIHEIFPNIETIVLATGANIKEISANDLKPFGKRLKTLFIGQNSFDVIDHDLFRYNPNLELISFYENKIRHIDDGAFDNLPKLTTFIMNGVKCADGRSDDRLATVKLTKLAERNCKDPLIANDREKIQALKYEIEKSKIILGSELEAGIQSIQSTVFELFNKTSQPDHCHEDRATINTIDKIRTMVDQYTEMREEQTKIWTRAKNELKLLLTKMPILCQKSSPNCAVTLQELQNLNRVLNYPLQTPKENQQRQFQPQQNFYSIL